MEYQSDWRYPVQIERVTEMRIAKRESALVGFTFGVVVYSVLGLCGLFAIIPLL